MTIKLLTLSLIFVALQAQESSTPTADLQARIAFLERKLQIYQQAAFSCQDARIDEQARQAKPSPAAPGK